MCKLSQAWTSASSFGTRRYVSFSQPLTQGLGQINFNVQYVMIIELQYACLVIVHWCSMSTHWGRDKMADISLTSFQMQVFSQGSNWQFSSIGSDNGLWPARWQAIIWTNDRLGWWRMDASLGLKELMRQFGYICEMRIIRYVNGYL